jgi:hypothetical protein
VKEETKHTSVKPGWPEQKEFWKRGRKELLLVDGLIVIKKQTNKKKTGHRNCPFNHFKG